MSTYLELKVDKNVDYINTIKTKIITNYINSCNGTAIDKKELNDHPFIKMLQKNNIIKIINEPEKKFPYISKKYRIQMYEKSPSDESIVDLLKNSKYLLVDTSGYYYWNTEKEDYSKIDFPNISTKEANRFALIIEENNKIGEMIIRDKIIEIINKPNLFLENKFKKMLVHTEIIIYNHQTDGYKINPDLWYLDKLINEEYLMSEYSTFYFIWNTKKYWYSESDFPNISREAVKKAIAAKAAAAAEAAATAAKEENTRKKHIQIRIIGDKIANIVESLNSSNLKNVNNKFENILLDTQIIEKKGDLIRDDDGDTFHINERANYIYIYSKSYFDKLKNEGYLELDKHNGLYMWNTEKTRDIQDIPDISENAVNNIKGGGKVNKSKKSRSKKSRSKKSKYSRGRNIKDE